MQLSRKKALSLYCELILKRIYEPISTKVPGICEVHHIIPKCILKWKFVEKSKLNKIKLYSHEHFLAHYYLTIIFPHNLGVQRAFYLMSNIRLKKKFKTITGMATAYEASKMAVIRRQKKTYVERFGPVKAQQIKIKQKKSRRQM